MRLLALPCMSFNSSAHVWTVEVVFMDFVRNFVDFTAFGKIGQE
jgi:hypothetical protein